MAILKNGNERCPLSVDANDVGLRRKAIADMRNIADVNHRAVHLADRNVIQTLDREGRRIGFYLVFVAADFQCTRRQDQVLLPDGVDNVLRGKPLGLERRGVEIKLHLSLLAAVRIRNRGAFNRNQLHADKILAVVVQLLFG